MSWPIWILILIILMLAAVIVAQYQGKQKSSAASSAGGWPTGSPPGGPAEPEIIITPQPSGNLTYNINGLPLGEDKFVAAVAGKLNQLALGDLEKLKVKVTFTKTNGTPQEVTETTDVNEVEFTFDNGKILKGYRVAGSPKDGVLWLLKSGGSFQLLQPVDRKPDIRRWREDLKGPVSGIEVVFKDPYHLHKFEVQTY
jgi:hypothetical protein